MDGRTAVVAGKPADGMGCKQMGCSAEPAGAFAGSQAGPKVAAHAGARSGLRPGKAGGHLREDSSHHTAYMSSTYQQQCAAERGRRRLVVWAAGTNGSGRGIEFDYAALHAAMALREADSKRSWVNRQSEDRSDRTTDISDRLYSSR